MYGIAEFLWGALRRCSSLAWNTKRRSSRLAGIHIWGQRYRTLSRNPLQNADDVDIVIKVARLKGKRLHVS